MNIQNQPLGPKCSAARQSDAASGAQKVDSVERAAAATPSSSQTPARDRVEISDAARAAQAQGQAEAQLIERGRSALREATSLDAERLASLRQRAAEGYYRTPEAADQIAERLTSDLTSGAAE